MIQVVIQPLMIPITKTWMKMWEDADDVYEELGEINTSEFKDLFSTLSNNKSGILKQENASNMHHTILNGSGGITTRLNIQFRLGENTRFPLIYEIRIHILRKLPQEKRDEGDDSCDEKTLTTRSGPMKKLIVMKRLPQERELENDESNKDFLKNSISLRRNTG
ncbi:unnamed protein product [Rhizophagus irregularis]|uniref:Uncharacterized protein n=1 Tax=Rhizophagus irregularis TaxID=588596 RepID=A0A915YPK8_9GLOM|nr:unnamed protein product [Rhizophagus irregularis]CAB5302441.1 unnamed protein product [Rhizophagus irregularis]